MCFARQARFEVVHNGVTTSATTGRQIHVSRLHYASEPKLTSQSGKAEPLELMPSRRASAIPECKPEHNTNNGGCSLLTTLGLILTVITLRFMYQSRRAMQNRVRNNGDGGIEMNTRPTSVLSASMSSGSTLRGDDASEGNTGEGGRPTTNQLAQTM